MAHDLEFVDGQASMAYAGAEKPWHGLGVSVPYDLTPVQMLDAANLNWRVEKVAAFVTLNDKQIPTGHSALVRDRDNRILDIITDDWNPCQNIDAFEFFSDFIDAGSMTMDTAGSLKDGKIVWALAKVNESFELFGGDKVDSYLLFTNPHTYGQSINVKTTMTRVVCQNTLAVALKDKSSNVVKVSHRREFDADQVKETLGLAKQKLSAYKEVAEFLGSKRYTEVGAVDYFKKVFPVLTTKENSVKELSKNARLGLALMESQPGVEFAEGSYWSLLNSVTYATNHLIGRSVDSRMTSLWYGQNMALNQRAMNLAIEMADA
jgi:phage/plasmid-like protein (TIGR03299 family)